MAAQDYEQVTYSSPDGAQVGGATTDLIGFWGRTPVTCGTSITEIETTVSASTVATALNLVIAELQRKGIFP